jgi:hypothetical protein
VGVFIAFEGLVTKYRGGYTWLLRPYDGVAPLFDHYLRSAHLEESTRASHVELSLEQLTCVRVMSSLGRLFLHVWTSLWFEGVGWRMLEVFGP